MFHLNHPLINVVTNRRRKSNSQKNIPNINTKIKTVNAVCNVSSLVGQTTFLISTLEPCKKLQKIDPLLVVKKINVAITTEKIIKRVLINTERSEYI